MNSTFFSKRITKQQFEKIQSNWKNISETEEEIELLDIPKSKMEMVLRVPITLNGRVIYMTVNCRIVVLEENQSILLTIIGSVFKPVFVSLLVASPIALVGAVLSFKPYLFIIFLAFIAFVLFYRYLNRVKVTSEKFVNELLKTI